MKELRVGMTLTAGGRTYKIGEITENYVYFDEGWAMYKDLAVLLPWEEPVGEWVTAGEVADATGWDEVRDVEDIISTTKALNCVVTRKYGQPPVKEVGHE